MVSLDPSRERPTSAGEEVANSVSHGVALLAALVATPFLVVAAARHGSVPSIVGVSVFGATTILLFTASMTYHALPDGRAKRRFELLDNAAIFLLIAGTYTPITLGTLRGAWGWSIFGVIWGLALVGVALTALGGLRFRLISLGLCLVMGWLVLIPLRPLVFRMPRTGILLILAGGLAYTAGVGFYVARRLPYHHLFWHLFVLLGAGCHFLEIYWYET
jgi:hemolysin III